MPLLTPNKPTWIRWSPTLFFLAFLATSNLSKADESEVMVLPTMTVFGKKNTDNTYTQTSEVAWRDSNDLSITPEGDGTYTVSSTTQSFSLTALISSFGKPTVNVDFAYAANSASMTAAGSQTLDTLLEAFSYLNDGVTLELTPTLINSESISRNTMQRRLELLRIAFQRSTGVDFSVKSPKFLSGGAKKNNRSEVWRIQIRRQS